ncbi:class I SAM-dependent methyltransferase [Fluviicola taffensis]|uniref:Methyltransferase type 12 n=1 Tax=Fluviicola taffensis (strain DSM 16823 / NCIMB 13979 / RW262) TaxID=755732 RepID=F2IH44_FLUTR|nr:class I SAM-dependent methyltransferase [Fluviicola taffensis]AEA45858.1 Methyltransferase type 12 [Fluviicola taffensis DSM 16823]
MSNEKKYGDPIGYAIQEYADKRRPEDIIVISDICEDDIIPLEVLFRKFDEMPAIEQKALSLAKGHVLDVGAGAGIHATYLQDQGLKIDCIDISEGAVDFLQSNGLNAEQKNFFDLSGKKYDTILMLMNGIGIAGKLSNLEKTLEHAKTLLNPGGKILCDSSDIHSLYEDEDGALWIDLNTEYYGNFRFQMKYKKEKGPWFDWLYVDFDNLFQASKTVGLKAVRVMEEDDHYLAELTLEK